MNIDLNLYKVFYIVAKCKNISKASQKLFISQPAVSKSIKTLETSLQSTLFNRNSKGVSLTKEGEIFFEHIEKVFNELTLAHDLLDKLKTKEFGSITIGVSSILGKNYFLPKLEKFISRYPNLKINIINTHTDNELQLIINEKLDLAIVCEPIINNNIKFIKLEEASDIFIASKTYLEKKEIFSEDDLFSKGSFMLLENNNITRKHIENYFYTEGLSIIPEIEASDMNFLIECAKMNLGITSVLRNFVQTDLDNNTLIELNLSTPIPTRYIGIAIKKNSTLSIAATSLIDFLKEDSFQVTPSYSDN